jgi:hypothetical protein
MPHPSQTPPLNLTERLMANPIAVISESFDGAAETPCVHHFNTVARVAFNDGPDRFLERSAFLGGWMIAHQILRETVCSSDPRLFLYIIKNAPTQPPAQDLISSGDPLYALNNLAQRTLAHDPEREKIANLVGSAYGMTIADKNQLHERPYLAGYAGVGYLTTLYQTVAMKYLKQ